MGTGYTLSLPCLHFISISFISSGHECPFGLRSDGPKPTRLRKQALAWLRGDLAAWIKLADDAKQHARIRQALQHWQKDADLAGIRDPDAVAKLPADEQEACKKLWVDVEALLKKVEEKK